MNEEVQKVTNNEEKNWAIFCHVSAFAGYLIPFGNVIGPLVLWLMKKDEFPLVDREGKKSLNFQISMTIYAIVSLVLSLVLIGFFLLLAVAIVQLVFVIMAAVKVSQGEEFSYPLTIKFIS